MNKFDYKWEKATMNLEWNYVNCESPSSELKTFPNIFNICAGVPKGDDDVDEAT